MEETETTTEETAVETAPEVETTEAPVEEAAEVPAEDITPVEAPEEKVAEVEETAPEADAPAEEAA